MPSLVDKETALRIHKEVEACAKEIGLEKTIKDCHHFSFNEFDRVIYIPRHAQGNRTHKDCEHGVVARCGINNVFVKFDKQIKLLGFEDTCAQACNPEDLIHEKE